MSRFLTVNECVDLALLGNDDLQKRAKGRLLKLAPYVYEDLNLTTLKIAKRELFSINKRTNSIDLPCPTWMLSSVNVIDPSGNFVPVFRNDNVKGSDIVDVSVTRDCACEHKCGYRLCNVIKGYEAITHTEIDFGPLGNELTFTCVDRKGIDADGFFYSQKQYPQREYISGVWTDTVLHTETVKMCKVEVDANGCCTDCQSNIDALCDSCGITNLDQKCVALGGDSMNPPSAHDDTWIYWCSTKLDWFSVQCGCYPHGFRSNCNNTYNISELGNRLIFPANFGWDKVMIRYYVDAPTYEILIPRIAVYHFIMGLKHWDTVFNDKKQALAINYEQKYTMAKWGLFGELNKYRIAEQRMIMTPPVYIPSYILPVTNVSAGYYDNY